MSFEQLCRDYLERAWRHDPVRTTRSGMRGYDHLWPDVTRAGLEEDRRIVTQLLERCEQQDRAKLSPDEWVDLECMRCDLQDALLAHDLAEWRRNPTWYTGQIATGIDLLCNGTWDENDRREALVARLNGVAALLELAEHHLQPALVPSLWVDIAKQSLGGVQAVIRNGAARMSGNDVAGDVGEAATRALAALDRYGRFLETLAKSASGDYAVGADVFTRILRERHRLDLTAEELHEWGMARVAEYEAELLEAAARIDANRSWADILEDIKNDYPPADQWLEAFQEHMATSRQHVIDHDLVTIPEGETCRMIWTPEHMWATYPLGGMDVSAPYTDDLESRFFVTPNDTSKPEAQQLEHHRDLNHAFLRSIALHEVYPGHHLQSVHAKQGQSLVRRWQRSTTLIEGWGLYTETLMHETGYLDDPAVHLMYVKNSLWRAVRVVIDVGLHARGMSFDEAVAMLQEKLSMEHHMAAGEVRRYTMTPTYQSSYLLGRTAILTLREEYKRRRDDGFTLREFHDRLLSYGNAPITLIHEAMLAD